MRQGAAAITNIACLEGDKVRVWEFFPEHPFEYRFAIDVVAARYQSEIQMRTIAQYASLLAMFMSAMGILGLAAYTASQRTKEIGVRKVLGASGAYTL